MSHILRDIYYFNPTCEYAVANGNDSWQPNKLLQKMESDLSVLPLFLAKKEDIVIVPKKPSNAYFETLKKLNLDVPQIITINELLTNNKLQQQSFGELLPWGWSPVVHRFLSPFKPFCCEAFKSSPVFEWKPEYRNLYSKEFSLSILKELKQTIKSDIFIPHSHLPEVCTTRKQIELLIKKWDKLMIKAPWSSSGRGLQPITKTPVHLKVWEKIMGIVHEQGYVIVEPYLDKIADLALQFELKKGKVSFLGISNFSTDRKGQYNGNYLNDFPGNYKKELIDFLLHIPSILKQPLIDILEKSELAKNYEGNLGVDVLVFKDKNNQLKINPCLEINVRQNMGLLSLSLEKLIFQNKHAIFRTYFKPGTSFGKFTDYMNKKHPLKITSHKIESGFFPLTETTNDAQFGAYILI